jgi:hypothetical protein
MRTFPSRLLALAAALVALACASPATAVTNGDADTTHANVGALMADFTGFGIFPTCTGILLAPTVFLTSGHCTEDTGGGTILGVSFAPDPLAVSPASYIPVAKETLFPGFVLGDPFTDLVVLELAAPADGITPAALPTVGQLESFRSQKGQQDRTFVVSGYGSPGFVSAPGGKQIVFPDIRRMTTSKLDGFIDPDGKAKTKDATVSSMLKLSQSQGHGGGICFGDSGGPAFIGDTDVVAGVTTVGTKLCTGIFGSLRLDTLPVRSFLSAFVAVP